MATQPTPLSAQIAALRTTVPAGTAEGSRLHHSIIAIISAILTRLFTRLERMVELWQAGTLPLPAPRHPSAPNPARPTCAHPDSVRSAPRFATRRSPAIAAAPAPPPPPNPT